MSKRLKTITELFEEKDREVLMELEYQKITEETTQLEKELSKRVLSPKIFFKEDGKLEEQQGPP